VSVCDTGVGIALEDPDALRKLLAGDFGFRDRGIESLKGVPGEWRLSMLGEA